MDMQVNQDMTAEEANDRAKKKIFELANVPLSGPRNREERRRVERVVKRLARRGLTIHLN
jgi:hypothetical protein